VQSWDTANKSTELSDYSVYTTWGVKHAQTAMIENGFVSIPQNAPWLAEYLHEMTVFPNGKHDDQVDSTAQFLDWFKKPFSGQNIFELYRREHPHDLLAVRLIAGDPVAAIGDQFLDQLGARCLLLDQDFGGAIEVLLVAHRALECGIFEPLPQQPQ
jgi:hypothetical protein